MTLVLYYWICLYYRDLPDLRVNVLQSGLCTCSRSFSSPLVASKKEEAVVSCKTCHDRLSVDGIGSVSASMTSTVGLELDLTWKTVSKGNRSGTRRTRKSVVKNLTGAVQVSDGNSRPAEDVTVSESEKVTFHSAVVCWFLHLVRVCQITSSLTCVFQLLMFCFQICSMELLS